MGIGSIAKTGFNYASRLILDDKFSQRVTASIKMFRKQKAAGKYTGHIGNMIKDSFVRAGKKTNPNVIQALKDSVISYGKETSALWKGGSGFFSKIGGTFKGLWKRAPLIGALMTVAFEIPNIYRATRDGGILNGIKEVGKSGVRLAAGIAAGAIGAAFLGPIGMIAGFIVGDWLGKLVVGKSHTEKLQEQEENQQEIVDENQVPQEEQTGYVPNPTPVNTSGQTQPTFTSVLPKMTMSPQELQMYGQLLYGGGGMNNDFMFNQAMQNPMFNQPKLDYLG